MRAVLMLSEFIGQNYDSTENMKTITVEKWGSLHEDVMLELGLDFEDLVECEQEIEEMMSA